MNQPSVNYNPSSLALALHRIATALRVVLPERFYSSLYGLAFRGYKAMMRMVYCRWLLYYGIRGDVKEMKKVKAIFRVMPYSLIGTSGLSATYDAANHVEQMKLDGCFVECGVARGGCAGLMGLVASDYKRDRKMWLFDSYEGLPDPTSDDYVSGSAGKHVRPLPRGACLGTYEEVQAFLFSRLGLDRKNICLVKGWFQETLPKYRAEIGTISLLRIDADWYESTKCCLEALYNNVVAGGYIIVDDYGSCFGCQKAVDEFLAKRRINVHLTHDGRGGCVFVKPT